MPPNEPNVSATERTRDDGSTEVDVVVVLAGDVHPTTPVTPTDTPDAPPVAAGTLAPSVEVTAPADAINATGGANSVQGPFDQPAPAAQPDGPKTTTAGQVAASGDAGGNTVVQRVDDPEKTPVPAADLDPSTVVHDPTDGPVNAGRGPVTAAELAGYPWPDNSGFHGVTSDEFGQLLAALDAAGYAITRKS